MNGLINITNLRNALVCRLTACVLSFFIVISSFGVVKSGTEISLLETAKISAETLMAQFFYISMLPVNVISKIFVESETAENAVPIIPVKNDKNKAKEENAAKASYGYSIIPDTVNLTQFTKRVWTTGFGPDKAKRTNISAFLSEKFSKFKVLTVNFATVSDVIAVLMLAKLLAGRNIGADGDDDCRTYAEKYGADGINVKSTIKNIKNNIKMKVIYLLGV